MARTVGPVTVMVSTNQATVERLCGRGDLGPTMGCAKHHPWEASIYLIRKVDTYPSYRDLTIETHEVCHVVMALREVEDTCHYGNHGMVR